MCSKPNSVCVRNKEAVMAHRRASHASCKILYMHTNTQVILIFMHFEDQNVGKSCRKLNIIISQGFNYSKLYLWEESHKKLASLFLIWAFQYSVYILSRSSSLQVTMDQFSSCYKTLMLLICSATQWTDSLRGLLSSI